MKNATVKSLMSGVLNKIKHIFTVDKNSEKFLMKISNNQKSDIKSLNYVVDNPNLTTKVLLALGNNPKINKNIIIKIANLDKSYRENGNLIFMTNNAIYNKVQTYNKNFCDKFYFLVSKNAFKKKIQKENIADVINDPISFIKKLKMEGNINNFFHLQEFIKNLKDLPFDIKIRVLKELGLYVEEKFKDSHSKEVFAKNNNNLISYYTNPEEYKEREREQNLEKVQVIQREQNLLNDFQKEMYYDKINNQKALNLIDEMANPLFIAQDAQEFNKNFMNKINMFKFIKFDDTLDKKNSLILINDLFNDYESMGIVNPITDKYFKDHFMKDQIKELVNDKTNYNQLER